MNTQSTIRESKRMQWDIGVALAIPGWIMLGGGVGSLLHLARFFADDVSYSSFIANWIPWVAVSFFVAGWLIAHGLEIALLDMRIGLTKILWILLFLLILTVPWTLSRLVSNPVIERLDSLGLQFMISGYFFRYSMFQKRSRWLFPTVLFGEKKKADQ